MNNEYTYDEEELEEDEFHGLTEEQYYFLIDSFNQCLDGFTWESWCDTGARDKEEFVALATKESCNFDIDDETLYEIFWEWEEGLDKYCFSEPEEYDDEEDDEDYDELADTIFDGMYSEVDVHTPNK
jgi:hypothetical protein